MSKYIKLEDAIKCVNNIHHLAGFNGRYCDLCGEVFHVDLYEAGTICPACRIAWRKIRDKVLFNEVHNER